VPKLLGEIKLTWNPETLCASFKLETDAEILEKKVKQSIEKYGVDLVVANELHTRKVKVIMYPKDGGHKVVECKEDEEIEDKIDDYILDRLK
jgi:phosphopantothenoylcysteine synthetase/decarboxylase